MERNASTDRQNLSSVLRTAILIVAIYSYFTGWVYTYYLFGHFGLSLNAVEIPPYYFFVYAYFAIPPASIWSVGGGAVLGAIAALLLYVGRRPRYYWVSALVLLCAFPILYNVARKEGVRNAVQMRVDQPSPVRLILKKEVAARYTKELLNLNDKGRLRMLTETKDRLYLLYQPVVNEPDIPYGYTYAVAKADVVLVTIEVRNVGRPKQ